MTRCATGVAVLAAVAFVAWRVAAGPDVRGDLTRAALDVIDVTSGDTLRVRAHGAGDAQASDVRLIGVRAPADAAHAETAIAWLRDACAGHAVRVSYDHARRAGPDGVAECYVYLDDGRMLNEMIIESGFAKADTSRAHELSDWFARLEGHAKKKSAGVWARQ